MSLQFSTKLCNDMLGAVGLKASLANGVIYIYSGPQPTNADAAVQGTLLAKISLGSGAFAFGTTTYGIEFDAPSANVISKAAAETWSGVGIAAGTAGWFRFMGNPTDSLASSTSLPRIDGSVAVSGGDLNLPSTTIAVGTPITIDTFQITLPLA